MYALTGASGQLGRLITQHLLTLVPATQIVATTRNPAGLTDLAQHGVAVRHVDFSDHRTFADAFGGVDRLLIISTDAVGNRVAQHQAAITAAVACGVQHITYTSAIGADVLTSHPISPASGPAAQAQVVAQDHGLTEMTLAASGVAWTALRNNAYAEALPSLLGPLLSGQQLYLPLGGAKVSWVTREDCARTAAGVLVENFSVSGPVDVTGPEALSFSDIAERLMKLGHPVTVSTLAEEDLTAVAVAGGLSERAASFIVSMLVFIAQTGESLVTNTVELATGVPASPVDTILRLLIPAS